jgi:hypothetical protein
MKQLGVGAYRFSIEWSRIEPSRGQIERREIQHYHDELGSYLHPFFRLPSRIAQRFSSFSTQKCFLTHASFPL